MCGKKWSKGSLPWLCTVSVVRRKFCNSVMQIRHDR